MSKVARARAVIVLAFLLALGAGVVVGIAADRRVPLPIAPAPVTPTPAPPPAPRSWLKDELKLTPEQEEQMRAIWSDAMRGPGKSAAEDRWKLQRERDAKILKLLTPEQKAEYDRLAQAPGHLPLMMVPLDSEQKAKYDALVQEYGQQIAEATEKGEKQRQAAVDRTKQILTDAQWKKYQEMLQGHGGHGHRGGPWGGQPGTPGGPGGPGGPGPGGPGGFNFPGGPQGFGQPPGRPTTKPTSQPAVGGPFNHHPVSREERHVHD